MTDRLCRRCQCSSDKTWNICPDRGGIGIIYDDDEYYDDAEYYPDANPAMNDDPGM
jgi:hypothetical protein